MSRWLATAGSPTTRRPPQELEKSFFLDEAALSSLKRSGAASPPWMGGAVGHRADARDVPDPSVAVPDVVAEFVAEQLGGVEALVLKQYGSGPDAVGPPP
ncbi:hypothetical protein GCM10010388_65880 [Streptomyces mauvecolor]